MGAYGQLIPLKTAPIATGSQFQLYPSHARGMGGVTLAVDDTQGDAFVNPAMAARLNGTWAFSAPPTTRSRGATAGRGRCRSGRSRTGDDGSAESAGPFRIYTRVPSPGGVLCFPVLNLRRRTGRFVPSARPRPRTST